MIINIDIEKAYDTIRWSAILATLSRMNFPDHWISWIHTYLNSASFSFFIDGQQTRWIYSSRGVRQGDPISSYLFVLVSQSLTNMLNLALSFGHIPGFNINFNIRFNHLMYADDLVIISRASRATAHNIIGCLEIYGFLTSQHINNSKSTVYFPTWFDKRVQNSICSILKINSGCFSFKYLGILISPKKTHLDF